MMQKAIRIPNIEGWILTDRGIFNTNEISCVMELRCESGERWVCVEEIDEEGFVMNSWTWYASIEELKECCFF